MQLKNSIRDYTESEFIDFINEIYKENASETDDKLDVLLNHFEKITEHPDGTDLIYYAKSDSDSTPIAITKIIKEWRAKNGKPGFKKG